MVEDLAQGAILSPAQPQATAAKKRIRERQPAYFPYADWRRLNTLEVARGRAVERPRVKFTWVEAMLAARRDSKA
jgi:hypothetical protein